MGPSRTQNDPMVQFFATLHMFHAEEVHRMPGANPSHVCFILLGANIRSGIGVESRPYCMVTIQYLPIGKGPDG